MLFRFTPPEGAHRRARLSAPGGLESGPGALVPGLRRRVEPVPRAGYIAAARGSIYRAKRMNRIEKTARRELPVLSNRPAPLPLAGAEGLRVGLITLGCDKNTVDSERILAGLVGAGARVADDGDDADVSSQYRGLRDGEGGVDAILGVRMGRGDARRRRHGVSGPAVQGRARRRSRRSTFRPDRGGPAVRSAGTRLCRHRTRADDGAAAPRARRRRCTRRS